MDTWTCLQCGTHNVDKIEDIINTINDGKNWGQSPLTDHLMDLQKQRQKVEDRGEIPIDKCHRCYEVRP